MPDLINIALNKQAFQSSLSRWSKPHESSGAVNGKKTGEFGFHTDLEPNPWWQVDLESIFPLYSILVYNRGRTGSELADRARSMAVFISTDGMQWKKVYSGGVSFGGVLDNNPLTINCLGNNARFVRVQLEEKNYLHLDQVEIFSVPPGYNPQTPVNDTYCPSLRDLGAKYGTDKVPHGFCEYYEKTFSAMRPRTTKVLEIGVFFGASLCMWRDWFPNAVIYGADHFTGRQGNGTFFENADRFQREVGNGIHPRITLHQLDQARRNDLEHFAGSHLHGTFDLIVDDASHLMHDQQQTLGTLFCLVKPGGYFVIEDLHSSISHGYDVEPDGSNSTLLMLERALEGRGWQSRYMTDAELNFLNQTVDLSQTRLFGSGGSQTCVIRRKLLMPACQTAAIVPGSVAIINYATTDELNQARQQQAITWARQWLQESKLLAGPGIVASDVVCFGRDSIDPEFYHRNESILSAPRGGGYWLWKPCIVEAMLSASNAEFLIYCDSGSTMIQPLDIIIETLKSSGASILAFDTTSNNWFEYQWTKGQVLRAMGATDPAFTQTGQIGCTASIWRVDDNSRKLAQEWLKLMQDPSYVTDSPSADGLGDLPGFMEHRHDQSIFSLLIKKQLLSGTGDLPPVITRDFRSWVGHHHITRTLQLREKSKGSEEEIKFRAILDRNPADFVALYSLGVIAYTKNDFHAALSFFEEAKKVQPGFVPLCYNIGLTLSRLGRYEEALDHLDKALAIDPEYEAAKNLKTGITDGLKNSSVSQPAGKQMEGYSEKLNKALELQRLNKLEEAMALFLEILAANPSDVPSLYSLGVIEQTRKNPEKALNYFERGLEVKPDYAQLWYNCGVMHQSMKQHEKAIEKYDKALALNPEYKEAMINRGAALVEIKRHRDALLTYEQLVKIDPLNDKALGNRGIILTDFKLYDLAIQNFERLLEISPQYEYALGLLAFAKLHACSWDNLENLYSSIVEGIRAGKRVCKTLGFTAMSDDPHDHLLCARIFANHFYPAQEPMWRGEKYRHKKIKVAYVSPDFREHPVGHLSAGIFENHDKEKFEVIAISMGIDDDSRLRQRMTAAFDRFIDVRQMTSHDVAAMLRTMEVDILIDLAGYTADSRTDIFAFRPAPIQVNFLGYSSTMGIDYFDYIIADRHIIPGEARDYYSEKVVYMPETYLPVDSTVQIAANTPPREEYGLPPSGFVFCSFNHDYKINPPIFDIWMRLLKNTPGSVLWLMKLNESAEKNLRREATNRGVDPGRIVFATRVPRIEDHLARYRMADLYLDTAPCNAHSTTSDVLRAGLPVLTCRGKAFAGRVAASLLEGLGLPELITETLADYEAQAFKLAGNQDLLREVREKLRKNLETTQLFNTRHYCRNLEMAFRAMWDLYQRGSHPEHITVGIGHPQENEKSEKKDLTIKIHDNVVIHVPKDLSLMTPYVLLEQEDWFESEIKFVRLLLRPGMKVIDVGANYGTYALTAARRVGIQGSVLAFEPASKTAAFLRRSIELNSFGNISLHQCALSDRQGEASLSLSNNSELNTLQASTGANRETVCLRTLDDCFAEFGRGTIEFFKLDAEGEETKILEGGKKFWGEQSPLTMFELKHGETVNSNLISRFEQLGNKIYSLVPGLNMLAPFDATAPLDPFQLNLFACKKDRAEALEKLGLLTTSSATVIPMQHTEKNLWLSFLKGKPYGDYFLPNFNRLLHCEEGDWPVYRQALNDFVGSHLPTTSARNRVAFLERSLTTLTAILDGKPASFPRLCTWGRVAFEAGKRGLAVRVLNLLIDATQSGQIPLIAEEPFLTPSPRFESLDPVADPADWCLSGILEPAVKLGHFSSYFTGNTTMPLLERLIKSRFQSPEMERRRQLIRLRSGLRKAPERCPALETESPENLNAEFWIEGSRSR